MKANTLNIMRGLWAISASYVDAHAVLLRDFLNGKADWPNITVKEEAGTQPVAVISGVYNVGYYTKFDELPQNSVVIIDLCGPITKYGDYCSYGSQDYEQIISRADSSEKVKAIILRIDSPGGEVSGTASLADVVGACEKPVVGWINNGICCSAAYWIACKCDRIYVSHNTDEVGSIGVFCTVADWNAYMRSEGLPVWDVYAPQSTDKNGDYRAVIEGDQGPMKKRLAYIADEFITTVKESRGAKLKSDAWQTGDVYFFDQAMAIGLIDGKRSLTELLAELDAEMETPDPEMDALNEGDLDNNTNQDSNEATDMNLPKLAALAGKQATDITAEELTEVNEELTAAGLPITVNAGATDAAELATLKSQLETANSTIADLQGQVKSFEEGAKLFTGSAAGGKQDPKPAHEQSATANLDEMPHNKRADSLYGKPASASK